MSDRLHTGRDSHFVTMTSMNKSAVGMSQRDRLLSVCFLDTKKVIHLKRTFDGIYFGNPILNKIKSSAAYFSMNRRKIRLSLFTN